MTGTLTLTEAAVLALLAMEGERSGYDLLKQVRKAIGYIWSPAKTQLYTMLPRLVRSGFASSRTVRQSDRPDKQLYRITAAGERALQAWFEAIEPGARDASYLKLFVGGLTSRDVVIRQVEHLRRELEERLVELRAIEPTNTRRGHDYYHFFLLDLGIQDYELRLRWADGVLAELKGEG
jgi:PadR family transcriptional regulator AphA